MVTVAVIFTLVVAALFGFRLILGPAEMRVNGKVLSEPRVSRRFTKLATHELVEMKAVDVELEGGAVVKAHLGTKELVSLGTQVLVLGVRPNWLSPRSYSVVKARSE